MLRQIESAMEFLTNIRINVEEIAFIIAPKCESAFSCAVKEVFFEIKHKNRIDAMDLDGFEFLEISLLYYIKKSSTNEIKEITLPQISDFIDDIAIYLDWHSEHTVETLIETGFGIFSEEIEKFCSVFPCRKILIMHTLYLICILYRASQISERAYTRKSKNARNIVLGKPEVKYERKYIPGRFMGAGRIY